MLQQLLFLSNGTLIWMRTREVITGCVSEDAANMMNYSVEVG